MNAMKITGTFGTTTFTPFAGENTAPLCNIAQLENVEADHNIVFPDDYKAFLIQMNGAKPSPRGVAYRYSEKGKETLSTILSSDDEIITEPVAIVEYFYALGHRDQSLELARVQAHVAAWGRPGLFGIASAKYGGIIVLDLTPNDNYGSVHFMHLEGVAELVENGIEVPLAYIAPNFTAFLGMFFDFDSVLDERFQQHLRSLKR